FSNTSLYKKYNFRHISISDENNTAIKDEISRKKYMKSMEDKIIEKNLKEEIMEVFKKSVYGRDKEIVKKYLFENRTYKDISYDYDISAERVRQIYHRTIKSFRDTCRARGMLYNS
ncbi:MAG: sigma factor-like helix-turn-helix DNA-binding protein, partial [archaeon]